MQADLTLAREAPPHRVELLRSVYRNLSLKRHRAVPETSSVVGDGLSKTETSRLRSTKFDDVLSSGRLSQGTKCSERRPGRRGQGRQGPGAVCANLECEFPKTDERSRRTLAGPAARGASGTPDASRAVLPRSIHFHAQTETSYRAGIGSAVQNPDRAHRKHPLSSAHSSSPEY